MMELGGWASFFVVSIVKFFGLSGSLCYTLSSFETNRL